MKKFRKYIIIVVLCLIVGVFFMINTKSEKKYYTADSSEIISIDVNDNKNKVNVVLSDDEDINVTYYDKKNSKYSISIVDQVLSISNTSSSDDGNINAAINLKNTSLTISVPASFKGTFTAFTFDECNIDDSLNFSSVDVSSLSQLLN